ncbi:bifunctional 3,4-dihydroxy-2-butanone-4-phosphate synthase/GTP cyclohydrolase II [Corynebacterium sp. 320]|uniref:bifunctional 3,4-dihydroxy-2-butanone-4-phosphate synthase/GTP cyclohydrolase II n=1 Tax=Corynebacterium TaxID=1716 RepID=UPI00125CAA1B|nr:MULTISPECIES: bifunctional 3,4-dihydroxy-2-butanone-4-phosphate synthase/GTP cyclohydrolase II [Corynebacterium]KAB1503684.1 bifunctional 3,4-dihydroxy-2-butanone-4-phosphate synthase/GTP cyclohydrolase II [Corynebacterium sp. 320]KAB1553215.1 bifunctional 3,4-dihydroxy-2-butanone-4-phosphate synthase/GTP cyclohydrolase II [Corynebacterium sp. 321]KAB1553566.1 bifunctional 3,4-dihydroxy-2-butanone-4-phosphate synthase/GTP cyclohydrolase II [Corynebacterium sp. 319]KAB3527820.1 bifunctional 3
MSEKEQIQLDTVERAIADIAAGKAVVVVDDEDRENEGDLIFAAELATPELVAFMVRHSSGYICVGMPHNECDRLGLPPMVARNEDVRGTAYTVTVDAAEGITTGISATDRAHTLRALADPASSAATFNRPGHVVPLRARDGGVLVRPGHTEASVDLAVAAGLKPAGALCEIVSEENPTDMARLPELRRFADKHDLALISIEQLIEWKRGHTPTVVRNVAARLPTTYGTFTGVGYTSTVNGVEHLAIVSGDVEGKKNVPVRVHSECLTGDILGSRRCDCGEQLDFALHHIASNGPGVVIYMRGQEGRGIGLVPKLRAYVLQDQGFDTVDANLEQGLPADAREYSAAAQILDDLGVESIQLITNNPDKVTDLEKYGVTIEGRIPVELPANSDNIVYLRTKRDRMGHHIHLTDPQSTPEKEH